VYTFLHTPLLFKAIFIFMMSSMKPQWPPYLKVLCSFVFDDDALLQFLLCVHLPGLLCLNNNQKHFRHGGIRHHIFKMDGSEPTFSVDWSERGKSSICIFEASMNSHFSIIKTRYLVKRCQFNLILQCSSTRNIIACITCVSKAIPSKTK